MSRGFIEQESVTLFSIAPTAAANTTYNAYVDMRMHNSFNQEVLWTAGAGGGTLSYKVYGTMKPFNNIKDAEAGDSGSVFQDVSSYFLGTSALTGTDIKTDSAGLGGKFTFLKIAATIANKDDATALYAYGSKSY